MLCGLEVILIFFAYLIGRKKMKSAGLGAKIPWDLPFIISAGLVAAIGVLLTYFGNPPNMGLCMSCFGRDIAGSIGLHTVPIAQYFRPEIPGLLLGAFIASIVMGQFNPKGGEYSITRFIFGAFMGLGAMMFLGCTVRMGLRLGGGDMNALVGFAGFAGGVYVGTFFLRHEYNPGPKQETQKVLGTIFPLLACVFLIIFLVNPDLFKFSKEGPASKHAEIWIAIAFGAAAGAIAFWGRLCFMRPFRDFYLTGSGKLFGGILLFVLVATALNLIFDFYKIGFTNQADRLAHAEIECNILGMFTVGLAAVLLDGCPIRQLVKAGSGDVDSAVTVFGMIAAASLSDNFGITCSPKAQPLSAGITVLACVFAMFLIAAFSSRIRGGKCDVPADPTGGSGECKTDNKNPDCMK